MQKDLNNSYKKLPFYLYNNVLIASFKNEFNIASAMNIEFTFVEYIKSQVNFPMVSKFYDNRDMNDYFNAYKLIAHNDTKMENEASMKRVLEYFYEDLILTVSSLKNINSNFDFIVNSKLDNITLECETVNTSNFMDKVNVIVRAMDNLKYIKVGD